MPQELLKTHLTRWKYINGLVVKDMVKEQSIRHLWYQHRWIYRSLDTYLDIVRSKSNEPVTHTYANGELDYPP